MSVIISICAAAILASTASFAQKKVQTGNVTSITLHFPEREFETDPVVLEYRTYGLFDELSETMSRDTKGGKCNFSISMLGHPIAIKSLCIDTRLRPEMFGKGYSVPEGGLIEPGDSILITFGSREGQMSVDYSGKGAEKFKVQQRIYNRLTAYDSSESYVKAYHEATDSISGTLEKTA